MSEDLRDCPELAGEASPVALPTVRPAAGPAGPASLPGPGSVPVAPVTAEGTLPGFSPSAWAALDGPPAAPAAPASGGGVAARPGLPTRPVARTGPGNVPGSRYVRVGSVTSQQLLSGAADGWRHLDDRLARVVEYVQDHLVQKGWSERIWQARREGPTSQVWAEVVTEIDRQALLLVEKERLAYGQEQAYLLASTVDEIVGLGPIEPLQRDPRITDIMVNGPESVYVMIGGTILPAPAARFRSREHLVETCQQILRPLDKSIDQRNAIADGRLADGSRVNITHHSLAADGPILNIRKFPDKVWTMLDMIESGAVNEAMACEIGWLVKHRASMLIAGPTNSGKTSLLNACSTFIPRDERVITIEDAREIRLHPDAHWIAEEARPPSGTGDTGFTIRDLVRNALRQTPHRIIVGEVRQDEAIDMLNAMSTGHEGSLSTLHADGPDEIVDRLMTAVNFGGVDIPDDRLVRMFSTAVDVIIFAVKDPNGRRRVDSVTEVLRPTRGETLTFPKLRTLWQFEQTGVGDDGSVVGEFVKVNDVSESLLTARPRLRFADPLTMDDVRAVSIIPPRER